MNFRRKLGALEAVIVAFLAVGATRKAAAQEHPAQRVANIVSVAIEEYKKGVDGAGRLIAPDEYQEAAGFLADGRAAASRLSDAPAALALLDSIIAAVGAR